MIKGQSVVVMIATYVWGFSGRNGGINLVKFLNATSETTAVHKIFSGLTLDNFLDSQN